MNALILAAVAFWLLKSEPGVYSWSQFLEDGRTRWEGVRNFEARNNLRLMQLGDECFFYHSGAGKEIVGIAKVVQTASPDPTAPGEDWSVVDIAPSSTLPRPVKLATIKATPTLAKMRLLSHGRLSVTPVTAPEWVAIAALANTDPSTETKRRPSRAAPKARPAVAKKSSKRVSKPKPVSTAKKAGDKKTAGGKKKAKKPSR